MLANDGIISRAIFLLVSLCWFLLPCPHFTDSQTLNGFPIRRHTQQYKQLVVRLTIDQAHQPPFEQLFSFLILCSIIFHCELDLHSWYHQPLCHCHPPNIVTVSSTRCKGKKHETTFPSGTSVIQT